MQPFIAKVQYELAINNKILLHISYNRHTFLEWFIGIVKERVHVVFRELYVPHKGSPT